ncbi:diaminopimelate decarboxylase [Amycolatopsis suaedae]|uniref:Diaminopimelate decarboxylase n=1 Tax=Amycolatopsis suaedae TaxID=2510978 RepID=A0A4Q7J6M6_9PSEU|nr:diaminopimelate decarboxylase [Amycolatopsis suaedae]RZQ61973.1 diaminopimelate decarboxylase [Amycolatopsis suaedae]
MTLAELLPSVGRTVADRLDAEAWPPGTRLDGDLVFAGVPAGTLAARFGTPAYLIDEAEVRRRARAYRDALPGVEVAFAGKALCCRAVLRWLAEEGLSLDTCSGGEVAMARSAGFPADRILLHGNAKTPEDLKAALGYGVGRIVLDSLDEIDQLGALTARQDVLIRVTPDVDGDTHRKINTGTEGQKFGFSLRPSVPDNLDRAVATVLGQPGLRLVGLHCHIGSQVSRVDRYELAARRMVAALARIRATYGIELPQLDLGGGHAGTGFDLTGFAARVRVALAYECTAHGLAEPRLTVEPGRAIVARAGITLYRVCAVKRGSSTFVAVDGGMSDNPRPALYGARYTARLAGRVSHAPRVPVTVVGRHCESGDVLAEDVPLPGDVRAGDLLAVPGTGAYHQSLASNYNLVGRPPLVGVRDGVARLLVRRETEEDLLAREA